MATLFGTATFSARGQSSASRAAIPSTLSLAAVEGTLYKISAGKHSRASLGSKAFLHLGSRKGTSGAFRVSLFDTLSHLFFDRSTEGVSHLGTVLYGSRSFSLREPHSKSALGQSRAAEFIMTLNQDGIPDVDLLATSLEVMSRWSCQDGLPTSRWGSALV